MGMKVIFLQKIIFSDSSVAVCVLPNEAWARRVSGVFVNHLANLNTDRGHAILTNKANGNFLVSVPLSNKRGAAELCRKFPTGGGREAAAGINDLPSQWLRILSRSLGGIMSSGNNFTFVKPNLKNL